MRGFGRRFASTSLVALLIGTATPLYAETLETIARDAYLYNPSIDAARANLRAQGENIAIANAARLPDVSLNGTAQLGQTFRSPGRDDLAAPLSLGVTGRLPLFDGGRAANSISQARASVDATYARLIATEQSTLQNAITAFFDVLRDKEARDLSRESLKLLLEELEASEIRFEVGEVTITDVAQTKARVAAANSTVIQADGNLRASAEAFRAVVGRLPGELDPPEYLPQLPETAAEAENEALATHPSIRAARSAERAAVYAIKIIQADKLPTVQLSTSLNGNLNDSLSNRDNSLGANVQLNLNAPVYQGGSVSSRVRQAQHSAAQARADYHAAVREVQRSVNVAWYALVTAKGAIASGEEQVAAAQLAFNGVKEELLVGSRATIDVLNAEQSLLNARISLVNSVRQLNVASYALLVAMGRLGPDFFGIPVYSETGGGTAGVEPVSPYAVLKEPTVSWRFPWRP